MTEHRLTLYELAASDPDVRFSPYCWKTRMALAHKGLETARVPWRFHDKEMIAFSGQGLVPLLVDGDRAVADSWQIANYLEATYPDRPSLFGGETAFALCRFVNAWTDTTLAPALVRPILMDVFNNLDAGDKAYFRATREKRFGTPLEAVSSDQAGNLAALRKTLTPIRATLADQPFICGAHPAYADYSVFGLFMWARCISPVALLQEDDPLFAWRERLLDAYDGQARKAPMAANCHTQKAAAAFAGT